MVGLPWGPCTAFKSHFVTGQWIPRELSQCKFDEKPRIIETPMPSPNLPFPLRLIMNVPPPPQQSSTWLDRLPIPTLMRDSRWKEYWQKFNIANLLFCYCLPFFYVFYPTLLMPAIFLRTLSLFIGWLYRLVLDHQKDPTVARRQRRKKKQFKSTKSGEESSSSSSSMKRSASSSSLSSLEEDMEYWLQRCSICLDAKYALCLEACRDQFCRECFAR